MHPQLKMAYRLPSMIIAVVGMATGMTAGMTGAAQFAQPADPPPETQPDSQPVDLTPPPVTPEPAPPADTTPAKKPPLRVTPQLPTKEHDADATAKLEQATKALKEAKSLKFKASFSVDGLGKDMMGTCAANVLAVHENNVWSFRLTGKGRHVQKVTETDFDLVYSGGNLEWLDADTKKLMIRPATQAKSKLLQASSSLKNVTEMFGANAFAGQTKAIKLRMGTEEKAGGVDCEVVVGEASDGQSSQKVFLGKEDHIPRRFVLERKTQTRGDMTITTDLTEMEVNASVSPSDVHLSLPEGYTKDVPPTPVRPVLTARPTPVVNPAANNPKAKPTTEETSVVLDPDSIVPTGNDSGPAIAQPVQPTEITPTATPAVKPPPPPPVEVTNLPDFELKDSKGAKVTTANLHGSPSVLLFWGTWSLSSKKALPEFATLADRYKDKAKFHAVAVRQKDPQSATKVVADAGYTFSLLLEGDSLAQALHVGAYPALYVFGADGELLKSSSGVSISDAFAAAQAALDGSLGVANPALPTKPPVEPKVSPKANPDVETDK
ncbi:MAG: TlpA disulfide reductase family protein [Planctomycetota bacterium]